MTVTGGDPGRVHGCGINFRTELRRLFRAALERLSSDGVVAIAAEELPGLVAQVREAADPKFGDGPGKTGWQEAARRSG